LVIGIVAASLIGALLATGRHATVGLTDTADR
jgi:hypothetical protein